MTNTFDTKENFGKFQVGLGVLLGFFFLLVYFVLIAAWHQSQWSKNCQISEDGYVIPTRVIEGSVRYVQHSVFIHSIESGDAVLGQCGGKGGCTNPLPDLLKNNVGEIIYAEYCENKLTKVIHNRVVIFLPHLIMKRKKIILS